MVFYTALRIIDGESVMFMRGKKRKTGRGPENGETAREGGEGPAIPQKKGKGGICPGAGPGGKAVLDGRQEKNYNN